MPATTSIKLPAVVYDGLSTGLAVALDRGGVTVFWARPDGSVVKEVLSSKAQAEVRVLSDYPVKRWLELMLQSIEVPGIVVPVFAVKIFRVLAADPSLEYTLDHFSKESIMATAAKKAAAEKTDAKAKNAAKTPAAEKAPAKGKVADTKAPAAKKTATKSDAAPAKQPTKAAKAADAGEGRKGRPSPHALDAKIGKGKEDFKAHVREGSHRYARNDFLVKNAGKTVGEVLGQEFEAGYPLVSKHISAALEAGYITLSK